MKRWLLPITIPLVIGLSYLTVFQHQTYFSNGDISTPEIFSETNFKSNTVQLQNSKISKTNKYSNKIGELSFKLRAQYVKSINSISTQANLLILKKQLELRENDQSEFIFNSVVNLSFPDQAQSIIRVVQLMEIYFDWLEENNLAEHNSIEKNNEKLWNKRHQLFGNDAEIIWKHERDLKTIKRFQFQERIQEIDTSHHLHYQEKINLLKNELETQFSDLLPTGIDSSMFLAHIFFNLESIQDHLRELLPAERHALLTETRQNLGFNKKQIKEMTKNDIQLSELWKKGKRYEVEIETITSEYGAKEMTETDIKELRAQLRTKYFTNNAAAIAAEEAFGFYRFQRDRTYGNF